MDPILIVDDEPNNLEALRRLLRKDYAVSVTTSPFEALKQIQGREYTIIISDQRMPEMTGVDLLEKVKNISPFSTRILLTGYTDIDAVIDAINRGNVYHYVAKPWDNNELKITLKQARETYHLKKEIEEKNTALIKSVTELNKALEQLKSVDRAKASFLSLVSHELNTPLTILNSYLCILSEQKNSLSQEAQKALAAMENATSRFSEIVSETLTYVELEAKGDWQARYFNLEKATKDVEKQLKKQLKEKGSRFVVQSKGKPIAYCDPEKMQLALKKLFQDIISRIPKGKSIDIEISEKEDGIHFLVKNNGEILSKDAFSPLRSDDILHHRRNLGLSLALCRLIVEGNGGHLELMPTSSRETALTLVLPHAAK